MSVIFHWDVVTDEVLDVIAEVARSIESTAAMDTDDLIQIGAMETAKAGSLQNTLLTGKLRHYKRALKQDLTDVIRTEWNRTNRSDAYDILTEDEVESEYYEPTLDLSGNGGYNEEIVKAVLPALFDDSYAMRLDSNPHAPAPGMPRGKGGQVSGPAHWDLIADVRTGWEQADLSGTEKQAVFLTCALEMPLREAAEYMGCHYSSVRNYTSTGLGKMVTRINGLEVAA